MKKILIFLLICASVFNNAFSQEFYGRTLNIGIGVGYYGYLNNSTPVIHLNYEIDAAKNFTLAPFISFYTYSSDYYYNDYYTAVVFPLGVKGTYYFDDLLQANNKWDFYAGASLGISIKRVSWDRNYTGERRIRERSSPLYLDIHVGAEYHINSRIGMFLDLSSGVSTFGIAFH